MTDAPFILSGGPAGYSAAAFGRLPELLKLTGRDGPEGTAFTDAAVCNWIKRGLPAVASPDGAWCIDKAAGLAWCAANLRAHRHGGARRNAGKKAGGTLPGKRASGDGGDEDAAQEAELQRAAREDREKKELQKCIEFLEAVSPDDPFFIGKAMQALSILQVDQLKVLQQVQKAAREESQARGKLVDVGEVAKQWREKCSAARSRLEAMPSRVAPQIAEALGLGTEAVPVVAARLRIEVALVVREIGMGGGQGSTDLAEPRSVTPGEEPSSVSGGPLTPSPAPPGDREKGEGEP